MSYEYDLSVLLPEVSLPTPPIVSKTPHKDFGLKFPGI